MGSPLEARFGEGSGAQRLAALSPFYLGAYEVTVARFRASGLHATLSLGGAFGTNENDFCTLTAAPGPNENEPINCVTRDVARDYCRREGGDLPTEAQYEYAASALRSAPFVWGTDPPTCEGVVMSRAGAFSITGDESCRQLGTKGGAAAVGSGALDRLDLPTGTVFDLIGNVSEFVRDEWNQLIEPCWSRPGLYVNPVCTTPGTLDAHPIYSLRGGHWSATPNRASGRIYARGSYPLHGFRCARPAD